MATDRGPQPVLTGRRVRLRPWRPDDAAAVCAACQDAEVQRWTEVPVPYLPAHAAEFVGPLTAAGWAEGGALFAADKLADGGVRRVELIAHPANTRSCRVAESAGFRAEGVLRSRYLHRGVPCDVVLYSLLTTDPRPPV